LNPESIFSYYPTYSILDEILSTGKYDQINIFIDLKNNLQTLYMEHSIKGIIEESMKSRFIDTSIFSSILSFLQFHKLYSIKRDINIKFYIFFETGTSIYHTNISKKYKINRRIDDLYGLDKNKRDYFHEIVQKNLQLTESVLNKTPDVFVIRLSHLEADFVPYYLIKNKLVNECLNPVNIIYSNDHDLYQCLELDGNNFIFSKSYKTKKIIRKGEVLKTYLKTDKNLPDKYLTFCMSIIGDTGDNVYGIKGMGPKRVCDIIEEMVKMVGGIENLRSNVINESNIFNQDVNLIKNKNIKTIVDEERNNKIISNNLKLVDFNIISEFLDNGLNTEMLERRKYIRNILNDKKISPIQPLKTALNKLGIYLQEELEVIYFRR